MAMKTEMLTIAPSCNCPGGIRVALLLALAIGLSLPAQAATITIDLSNFQFVPKNQTVNVGDTITWVNQDFTQHDTTSGTNGIPNGLWHSALLSHGQTFSFTFNSTGLYPYFCTPHVFSFNMVGLITVVAPNQPPIVSIATPALRSDRPQRPFLRT
jgi:plastocyanin